MATLVRHGKTLPQRIQKKLSPGRYRLTLKGRYMKMDGWQAGGVTDVAFASKRDVKRRSELLGMRTIFVHWFYGAWHRHGGTWAEAERAFTQYPFRRLRRRLLKRRR